MVNDKKAPTTQEFYLPPPQLSKWESFKLFLYNGDTGEVMGRTGGSWAKIGLFYMAFYSALAAFFAVMLVIFYQTISYVEPKWKMDEGLIGSNPGLGYRPMPGKDNAESTLIWFRSGEDGNWKPWFERLKAFLDDYEPGKQTGHTVKTCTAKDPPGRDQVCHFDITLLGDKCTKEYNFGYDVGRPCVVIKLNRIYGWAPVPFTADNISMATNMPEGLQEYIRQDTSNVSKVWMWCEGENAADRENMGKLEYKPSPGVPTYYFPYYNTNHYRSPLVMIQFTSVVTGVLINIECRAWAYNIEYNRMDRRGSVHFELLVD